MGGESLIAAVTGAVLPRHAWIESAGLRLHCLEWGDAAAPPVLLIHGNGGNAHWWDPLVPFLTPGWRLVAPDLRGHGESEWPREPAYGIADCSGDLAALLDQLGLDRVAVIAHSMGARIAVWLAAHHPARVRGLALLDTTLAGVDEDVARQWRGRTIGQRQGRVYATRAEARAAFRFVPPEPEVATAIADALAYHAIYERAPGEWSFRFDRGVLSLDGDGAGDLLEVAAGIGCPLWMGRGTEGSVTPRREVKALQARRDGVEAYDFAGGHHFFLSHPREAGMALRRFIDRLPA
ncbi:MAG TPA: alpha/beta hydrolase [Candidatus Dormibacteraeota bacterium]|nr:alpha/beta hydrolase [Candidatus Dormibacteraeota bacterium]